MSSPGQGTAWQGGRLLRGGKNCSLPRKGTSTAVVHSVPVGAASPETKPGAVCGWNTAWHGRSTATGACTSLPKSCLIHILDTKHSGGIGRLHDISKTAKSRPAQSQAKTCRSAVLRVLHRQKSVLGTPTAVFLHLPMPMHQVEIPIPLIFPIHPAAFPWFAPLHLPGMPCHGRGGPAGMWGWQMLQDLGMLWGLSPVSAGKG